MVKTHNATPEVDSKVGFAAKDTCEYGGQFQISDILCWKEVKNSNVFFPLSDPQNASTRVTRGHTWFIQSLWGEGTRQGGNPWQHRHSRANSPFFRIWQLVQVFTAHIHVTRGAGQRGLARSYWTKEEFITLVLSNCCLFV